MIDPIALAAHKKSLVQQALELGLTMVFVNTTLPGIQLPDQFLGQRRVLLNLSYKFRNFMELRNDGIHTELSFNGQNSMCVIPWHCIWGVMDVSGNLIVYRHEAPLDDLPQEVIAKPSRPKFEVIKNDDPNNELLFTQPRSGHLKLLN